MINLDNYKFQLPGHLIAQKPAEPRDSAKLLVYSLKTGQISDDYFYNLPKHLKKDASLVINNTKVKKARLKFSTSEVFILEEVDDYTVWALVFPGKKFRVGISLNLNSDITVEVLEVNSSGHRKLKFSEKLSDPIFDNFKLTPLPPYIKQDESLADEYQTVFASGAEESLAAPTAGLHFTDELLNKVKLNHQIIELELTVGLGTFANITEDNIKNKKLHSEQFYINKSSIAKLKATKSLTAVGTTSVRALESSGVDFKTNSGSTDIFIYPGYKFRHVDSLITNFHLPGTSLLLLVTALLANKLSLSEPEARQELLKIYSHAVKNNYRFFSFGDAMMIV